MHDDVAPDSHSHNQIHWTWIIVFAAVFCGGFWVVDHTPFASDYFKTHSILAETENRTADRIEAVNVITAPVRIFLGVLGIGLLVVPSRDQLRWGGLLIVVLSLFLLYTGCSALWSVNPKVSVQKFLVLCFFAAAAFGLAKQFSVRELAILFSLICLAYIAIGVLAELALGNFAPYKKDYRFVGTCHPNSLAVYGSFCCLVAIAYFNRFENVNRWLILIFIIGSVTLLMTKSRTTLAGFCVSALVTLFLTFKPNDRVFAVASTMLIFVLIGLALTLSRSNVRAATAEKLAMGRTKDVSTLTGRLPLWELLMESVEDKPLTGFGYLAYWDKERIEFLSDQLRWEIPHGHNMYIDVMLDGGMVGLTLFVLVFIVGLTISGFRSLQRTDPDMILVCGFLTFAVVHGFAESLFKLPTFLLFILIALLLRTAFQNPRESEQDPLQTDAMPPVAGAAT